MKDSDKVYFPNLNSVRAIAAIMVVVSHIEKHKNILGLEPSNLIIKWGSIGVTLFFVLSGFLITYLLLIEDSKFSKIDVKNFYIRRILRIWPLYFLILAFVYLSISYILPEYYKADIEKFSLFGLLLNLFFLTNLTDSLVLIPGIISTIWSIGVEEQFYIFWPWVIKAKKENRVKLIAFIVVLLPLLKILFILIYKLTQINAFNTFYILLTYTRFDSMAIGALFAFLAFYKRIELGKVKLKYETFIGRIIQIVTYILVILFFIFGNIHPALFNLLNYEIFPVLFGICILNLATNKYSIVNLENNFISYLGKISYSIYLNHMVVLFIFFPYLNSMLVGFSIVTKNLIIFPVTLILVIGISILTYNWYEKQFLKLKHKFSHVKT